MTASQTRAEGLRRKAKPEKRMFAKAMRQNPTPAEAHLWCFVRRSALGVRFHRQSIIRGYIADFYCPAANLIVEVDGQGHDAARDEARTLALKRLGFSVLRFSNEAVLKHTALCVDVIKDAILGHRGEA